METKTFYFNPIRECCYVAWDETGSCVFIDPGCNGERELQRLKDFVAQKQLKPEKILLTHGHFDHILGLENVAQTWGVDAWIHPDDHEQMVRSGQWCSQLGLAFKPFTGTLHDLSDGEILTFGQTQLRVITTPGHTQGGVCFLCEKDGVLFSGDTLFAGSIGRTDHPGGDYDQLIDSIGRKLLTLDGDITILPGHGPTSSIGYERATNPFLQSA
ncbi:MAG: MBL fold metallo-hydrolase [Bacteroidales bacterium]|nr:MBL fold metallo-hydrolase [Bacteroidales bacterium]